MKWDLRAGAILVLDPRFGSNRGPGEGFKKMTRARVFVPVLIFVLAVMVPLAIAGDFSDEVCADCHTNTGGVPSEVSTADLRGSIHEDFSCTDCHSDIQSVPHAVELAKPDCGVCHEESVEVYTQHGRGVVGVSPDVPTCQECHGSHHILPHTDSESMVHASKNRIVEIVLKTIDVASNLCDRSFRCLAALLYDS